MPGEPRQGNSCHIPAACFRGVPGVARGHDVCHIPTHVARERFGDVFMQATSGSRSVEQVGLHEMIVEVRAAEDRCNIQTFRVEKPGRAWAMHRARRRPSR